MFYGSLIFDINQLSATMHDRCRDNSFMPGAKGIKENESRQQQKQQSRQTIKHKQTAAHGAQSRPYAMVRRPLINSQTSAHSHRLTQTVKQWGTHTHIHTHTN